MQRYLLLSKLLVIGLFVIAISSPVHALREGVIGIWLFDEGAGDEVADSSGNGHTGIAVNGNLEWEEGKFGAAGKFAPGGGYVEVEDADALDLETFTIETWVNISDNGGGDQNIIYKQDGANRLTRNYNVKWWAGRIFCVMADGKTDGMMNLGANVVLGDWHHVAFTYDGEVTKIYIDGEIVDEIEVTGIPVTNEAPMRIGHGITGLVDEIQILNVALTAEEIQEDMKGIDIKVAVEPIDSLSTKWGQIKSGH